MARKTGLGRGLAALLGEDSHEDALAAVSISVPQPGSGSAGVIDIPVNTIRRNPRQPRRVIDASALDELSSNL
jgi:hypothetical protein